MRGRVCGGASLFFFEVRGLSGEGGKRGVKMEEMGGM